MAGGMFAGFQPSPISYITTAILDRGQYTQPVGSTTQVGQRRPDMRNPLYQASAEAITALPKFLAKGYMGSVPVPELGVRYAPSVSKTPRARESSKDYEVLPGGEAVYFGDAGKLVPFGPGDWPPNFGARRTLPMDVAMQYRVVRPPRSAACLSFPDDRDAYGHYSYPSEKLKGRQGANTY